eukprot:Nitzschia sp. Nitz4//scaffold97_size77645//43681//44984//NITZ4_005520-RA/size77645-augustus-gene-0.77-mRNA-1//-1//CDS//3329560662//1495//frame0
MSEEEDEMMDEKEVENEQQLLATMDPAAAALHMSKKKRLCRYPGCTKVIKSQGHCQRHGAKAKRCKVEGCDKQAQGTHDGMCKRHWKATHFPGTTAVKEDEQPPPPEGVSVYDGVLPNSISYRPGQVNKSYQIMNATNEEAAALDAGDKPESDNGQDAQLRIPPSGVSVMPLVEFLRAGSTKEPGWHRNAERRARGLFPINNLGVQLEPWERQLALVEILLLSGGTPFASFKDLAHAWGREKGFHHTLASNVCERRGEVERKRRSDAGKTLTDEQRESFRNKLKRSRTSQVSPEMGGDIKEEAVMDDNMGVTTQGGDNPELVGGNDHVHLNPGNMPSAHAV